MKIDEKFVKWKGIPKEELWFGIKRSEIDWFPTIDYKKCNGCMACLRKCTHGVFSESEGKVKAVSPYNCVVGCNGCDKICPQKAISHPPKEYLEKIVKRKDFKIGCQCGGN